MLVRFAVVAANERPIFVCWRELPRFRRQKMYIPNIKCTLNLVFRVKSIVEKWSGSNLLLCPSYCVCSLLLIYTS